MQLHDEYLFFFIKFQIMEIFSGPETCILIPASNNGWLKPQDISW